MNTGRMRSLPSTASCPVRGALGACRSGRHGPERGPDGHEPGPRQPAANPGLRCSTPPRALGPWATGRLASTRAFRGLVWDTTSATATAATPWAPARRAAIPSTEVPAIPIASHSFDGLAESRHSLTTAAPGIPRRTTRTSSEKRARCVPDQPVVTIVDRSRPADRASHRLRYLHRRRTGRRSAFRPVHGPRRGRCSRQ